MTIEVGTSLFRVRGKICELMCRGEWLQIWKITIIQNNNDLAIDVDCEKKTVNIVKRDTPVPKGVTRTITDDDIVVFDLENGEILSMPITSATKKLLKTLWQHGASIGPVGKDFTHFPWDEKG